MADLVRFRCPCGAVLVASDRLAYLAETTPLISARGSERHASPQVSCDRCGRSPAVPPADTVPRDEALAFFCHCGALVRADVAALVLHRSPRDFGKPTSLWTLALVAAVCHEKGWTERALSAEAIRLILKRLGVGWKRAKHWITSPDPAYAAKKKSATA